MERLEALEKMLADITDMKPLRMEMAAAPKTTGNPPGPGQRGPLFASAYK